MSFKDKTLVLDSNWSWKTHFWDPIFLPHQKIFTIFFDHQFFSCPKYLIFYQNAILINLKIFWSLEQNFGLWKNVSRLHFAPSTIVWFLNDKLKSEQNLSFFTHFEMMNTFYKIQIFSNFSRFVFWLRLTKGITMVRIINWSCDLRSPDSNTRCPKKKRSFSTFRFRPKYIKNTWFSCFQKPTTYLFLFFTFFRGFLEKLRTCRDFEVFLQNIKIFLFFAQNVKNLQRFFYLFYAH